MKQFSHEFKQHVIQETFSKNIFMVKRMKKVFQYLRQVIVLSSKMIEYYILKIATT